MLAPQLASLSAMSEEFHNFNRLPTEIRSMIWDYSLPEARVYEVLDAPNAKQRMPAQDGLMFANVRHEPPPALAAVCRESRYFVLHHYKPLRLGSTIKYVDLSRDVLLLEPYLLVKRLHRTLHFMSQIPLVRDNINRLALGTSYGMYTGICHPVLSWKVSKNNMGKLLAKMGDFPRLKELIFVVHQEFQFEFDCRYPHLTTLSHHHLHHLPPNMSSPTAVLQTTHPSHPAQLMPPPPPPPPPPPTALASRPQLVHQAYRFKFDIEANINYHHPRRPHVNELQYYPLDRDEDDWDKDLLGDEDSEYYDPWPTNDDWRRFRRRFLRAVHLSLELGIAGGVREPTQVPALKGASLLWRYTRGGYV